jgi:hypothetical protein
MGNATDESLDATHAVDVSRSDDAAQQQDHNGPNIRNSRHEQISWSSRFFNGLSFVPRNCRYDPDKPFKFSMKLNILFGERLRIVEAEAVN